MPINPPLGAESVANDYLFNFSASFLGGGFKRLHAYAKWFDSRGGATFVLHPQSLGLASEFPRNRYFSSARSRIQRVFNDWKYLDEIVAQTGRPGFYYSYGIPIYRRVGDLNWFHLSNVLPLRSKGIPMPIVDSLRVRFLGSRMRRNLRHADVVSGESLATLSEFPASEREKLFLSVNGSDDEIDHFHAPGRGPKSETAVVVGTYSYKALDDSVRVFEQLKRSHPDLRLVIVGDRKFVPRSILDRPDVDARGLLPRPDVIDALTRAKYYISTTLVENSYNAASEGMVFADESFISDIGPHRELLATMPFEKISIPGVRTPVFHVRRADVSVKGLKRWDAVIEEMLDEFRVRSARVSAQGT